MKKFLLLAFILTCLTPLNSVKAVTQNCTTPFLDISGHWAEVEICFLYSHGIVSGKSERSFSPDTDVTRAEFIKIALLNKGYNVYAVQSASFTDLDPTTWYYSYVTFAHSKGFVTGYTDGSFHPNSSITRAEAVQIMINIAGISSYSSNDVSRHFTDVKEDDWYADAVAVATEYDIIEGYGDNSFRPNSDMSRAEAVVIAFRTWKFLYSN